jgi:hypothetical protein
MTSPFESVDSADNHQAMKTENTPTLKNFNESSDSLTMLSPDSHKFNNTPLRFDRMEPEAVKLQQMHSGESQLRKEEMKEQMEAKKDNQSKKAEGLKLEAV